MNVEQQMASKLHLATKWCFWGLLALWGLGTLAYLAAALHGRTSLMSFLAHNLMTLEETTTMGQAEATNLVLAKVGLMAAATIAAGVAARLTRNI